MACSANTPAANQDLRDAGSSGAGATLAEGGASSSEQGTGGTDADSAGGGTHDGGAARGDDATSGAGGSSAGGSPPVMDSGARGGEPDPADDEQDEGVTGGDGGGGVATGGTHAQTGGAGGTEDITRGVSTNGRQLIVDGTAFQIRGVNWNPVPKGGVHPANLDYAGFADTDIPLMQAAGINAIRTYEHFSDPATLDKLQAAGIYVFMTVYGWWQDDPSVVTDRVNSVKEHPAILSYVLGNEWNYNQLYADGQISTEQAREQINAAAALVKAADPNHPVSSIYGELGGLQEMVVAMPDIDLWGINTYRGISHGDLFSSYAAMSDKPMFLGEYGADAFNATTGMYDPDSQAQATSALTRELLMNSSSLDDGVAVGGFLFEWADEWWKDGGGSASEHDTGGIAPGGGPFPDQTFNEEWWGIVDIDRNPRPAYEALRDLYLE